MKKLFAFIKLTMLMLLLKTSLVSAMAISFHTPHTSQPGHKLQSETFSSDVSSYKIAGVVWLPDYQGGINRRTDNSSSESDNSPASKNCTSYGFVNSCPSGQTGTEIIRPYSGLTCYKGCKALCGAKITPAVGEICAETCEGNCVKVGCKPAVTMTYANDICTEHCTSDSSICTAKSCSPACTSSPLSPYGTYVQDNKCGANCNIAYTDNCRNRTAVSCTYGCSANFSDCSSKCSTCYPDNCRNRTEISIPANATCSTNYSDCSSKCSNWGCKNGFANTDSFWCTAPHTIDCATLGYTKTDAQCGGKTKIYCLFDKTKFTCF